MWWSVSLAGAMAGLGLLAGPAAAQHQWRGRALDPESGAAPVLAQPHEVALTAAGCLGPDLRLSREVAVEDTLPSSGVRVPGGVPFGLELGYRYHHAIGRGWALCFGPAVGWRYQIGADADWSQSGMTEGFAFDAIDFGVFAQGGLQWSAPTQWLTVRADLGLGGLYSSVDVRYEADVTSPLVFIDGSGSKRGFLPAMRFGVTVSVRFPNWGGGRARYGLHLHLGYLWADALTIDMDDTVDATPGGTVPVDFGKVHYRASGVVIGIGSSVSW